MTSELKNKFVEELGTGTGPTRYRHLRELAKVGGLPLQELPGEPKRFSISNETLDALKELTDKEWTNLFNEYRQETKDHALRLSEYGLTQIKDIIAQFPNNQE